MTRDLLLFLRAPLAATAVSNVCLGLALARPAGAALTGATWLAILCLACGSACLLWAGMGLNDLFDLERDRTLHPQRPLPSGRLPHGVARLTAWGLLVTGVASHGLASWLESGSALRGLFGASGVALCILAYDGWLKRWRLPGALAMGSCRASNALAGAYALGWWAPVQGWAEGAPLYAAILGGYVASLTFLSTYEEEHAGPLPMTLGFFGVAAAPGVLLALCLIHDEWRPYGLAGGVPLFGVVLAQWIMAILEGTRARGEATTMAFLKALWLLDLGVLCGRLPEGWPWVLGLGALLWTASKLAARRLFRPPPGGPPAPAEASLEESGSFPLPPRELAPSAREELESDPAEPEAEPSDAPPELAPPAEPASAADPPETNAPGSASMEGEAGPDEPPPP